VTVAELIAHVRVRSVTRTTTTTLATRIGTFDVTGYRGRDGAQHIALSKGDLAEGRPVLARVHSECLTGDVFGSLRCDCGEQLESALQAIEREGRGVLVYLAQEGRGIGLLNKLRAYALQDEGLDTVDANLRLGFAADEREYGEAAAILADLGIRAVRLLTNNPRKVAGLEAAGVAVTERLPLAHAPNPHNTAYLQTKRRRLGHVLEPDVNVR
jgi:3,4-dihydroxy 2-butanone 4-phosphate synthase / GTP cyclohydrolase II